MDLTPDDWARIAPHLDAALDLPAQERAAYLDALDLSPDLRAHLDALLDADATTATLLDTPERLGVLIEAAQIDDRAVPPGTEVGPYRVLREIGRGGMGTVVLAERADGTFEKQVALKLVRADLASPLLNRFRAERRILARLEHPGIARLLDGGRTENDQPYLVMEYVAGIPITDYADQRTLSVEARLDLFEQVCEAVAYAHRQLVVHRDLKPSNILVMDEDGRAHVKLLDFGIAKLLDEGPELLIETRTGQQLMTPAYAAPEQVRGEVPSTATDVYALGVLLYELLTGRRPYRLESRARQAMEQAILHDTPTRPSTAVTEPDARPETSALSVTLGLTPSRLRRRLTGDLDQIVLTALRKEPERRYESAAAFGRDIRRHLDALPVEARPDSTAYRISRFVRRHRAGVAAAAIVILALIGGLGAALWQARIASAERDRAATARDEAQAVSAFMTDLFDQAKPSVALGDTVTARDVLDAGARQIRDDLDRHPGTRAALLLAIGKAYVNIGDYAAADTLLRDALRLRQLEAQRGDLAPGARRDAQLGLAAAHYQLGATHDVLERYDEAETHYVAAIDTYRESLGGADAAGLAEALADLGTLRAWTAGAADAAVPLLEESRSMYRRLFNADTAETSLRNMVAYSTGSLGIVQQERGDSTAAEALYREAIDFLVARGGGDSPTLLDNRYMLATLLGNRGQTQDAIAQFREIIPAEERVMGASHPAHASTLASLADLLHRQREDAEAIDLYDRAIDIRTEALGSTHPSTLNARFRRGRALLAAQRAADAHAELATTRTLCRQSRACDQPSRGADFLADVLLVHAQASMEIGRSAEALELARSAQQLYQDRDDAEKAHRAGELVTEWTRRVP